jgi:squalene synthase HpnC
LRGYREELERIEKSAPPGRELFRDLARVCAEYRLPLDPFHDLLSAFEQDVRCTRYENYDELVGYCRRSANPVGRLVLLLFGRADETTLPLSDSICTSLQLINFWQDVALDWQKGRVYLPRTELKKHGVQESDIALSRCNAAWRRLMSEQVDTARRMMLAGAPLGRRLPGRLGLEIRATIEGGLAILRGIEAVGFDVFHRRPVLRPIDWPGIFWRAI